MYCYWFLTLILWSASISSSHGRSTIFQLSGWSMWATVSSCSVTCGTGSITRTRECIGNPMFCIGSNIDFRTCHAGCCTVKPEWCEWSSWSDFEYTRALGMSKQTRYRECGCPVAREPGASCEGDDWEDRLYDDQATNDDYEIPDSHGDFELSDALLEEAGSGDESDGKAGHFDIDRNDVKGTAADGYFNNLPFFHETENDPDIYDSSDGDSYNNDPAYDGYPDYHDSSDDNADYLSNPPTFKPLTGIEKDCGTFHDIKERDQNQANHCCDVLKIIVANNETFFENENLDKGYSSDNHQVHSNDGGDFPVAHPQLTSSSVDTNISEFAQCLSKALERPDGILSGLSARRVQPTVCSFPKGSNILNTVCCIHRNCNLWSNGLIKDLCVACVNARRCYCNGVPLSG